MLVILCKKLDNFVNDIYFTSVNAWWSISNHPLSCSITHTFTHGAGYDHRLGLAPYVKFPAASVVVSNISLFPFMSSKHIEISLFGCVDVPIILVGVNVVTLMFFDVSFNGASSRQYSILHWSLHPSPEIHHLSLHSLFEISIRSWISVIDSARL